jgi:hypothetical protein
VSRSVAAAGEDTRPDVPEGAWLGVSRGRLVALVLVRNGLELRCGPAGGGGTARLDRVTRRGRRVRLGLPGPRRPCTVRLIGPGDFPGRGLGADVGAGLLDGGGGMGDDPISAVIGVLELLAVVVAGPFLLVRRAGRAARGREEGRRLAAALGPGGAGRRPGTQAG